MRTNSSKSFPARVWQRIRPIRLDGYILTEFLGPFLGSLIFVLFILLMLQVLRLAEFFIVHGVALSILLKIAAFQMISTLPLAVPIAFLLGVLISFGRLSADSEIVAMKAHGVSIYRQTAPLAAFSCFIVVLSLFLNAEWAPWAERSFKHLLINVGNSKAVGTVREGAFTSGFFDLLIFADKVDSKTNRLSRIFIYDEHEPKNPMIIVARSGEIVPVRPTGTQGSAAMLKLWSGSKHKIDRENNTYERIAFGQERRFLTTEEETAEAVMKPRMVPWGELVRRVKTFDPKSFEGREMTGELWRRYAVALTPIIFVFLGIGFGTVRTRAVRAGAALVSLVTLSIYWGVQTAATVGILRGILHPIFAMQLPNLVLAVSAIFSYRKATW